MWYNACSPCLGRAGIMPQGSQASEPPWKGADKEQWPSSSRIETQSRTSSRFLRPWSRRHGHTQILAAVAWDEKKPASQVGSAVYI